MNKNRISCVVILTFLLSASFALHAETTEKLSAVQESVEETAVENARRWDLNAEEWQRYQEIMKGEGRYNWQNADPVTVLGIYAKTDAERERYAERVAIRETILVERFTSFNLAYLRHARRINEGKPAIDMEKFYAFYNTTPPSIATANIRNKPRIGNTLGDRFILFISPGCNGCDASFQNLRRAQGFGTGLDIYFVGASDQDIMDWAKTMAIDPDLVKNKTVTLNGDNGTYARYNRPPLPAAFYYRKDTESVHPVNLDDGSLQ